MRKCIFNYDKYQNSFFLCKLVSGAFIGLSWGHEEHWGDLLRKDGDPVYEDKGVVERGKKGVAKNHF